MKKVISCSFTENFYKDESSFNVQMQTRKHLITFIGI